MILGLLCVLGMIVLATGGAERGVGRAIVGCLALVLLQVGAWILIALGVGWVGWIIIQLPSHFR